MANAVPEKERALMDAYWRGANYLTGTLSVLGCYRDIPAVKAWNGSLIA